MATKFAEPPVPAAIVEIDDVVSNEAPYSLGTKLVIAVGSSAVLWAMIGGIAYQFLG